MRVSARTTRSCCGSRPTAVYNAFYYNFTYIRDNWTKGRITSVPSFVGEKNIQS